MFLRDSAEGAQMDFWQWVLSPAIQEISFRGVVTALVVAVFAGWLVPRRISEEYKRQSEKKDATIEKLVDQNSRLLAGIRIADHFYGEFLNPAPPKPIQQAEEPHVGK